MGTAKPARTLIWNGFLAALIATCVSCSSTASPVDASAVQDATVATDSASGNGEPCSTLVGRTFVSVQQTGCAIGGLDGSVDGSVDGGSNCLWTVTFRNNGYYSWRHADVVTEGAYRCQGGALIADSVTASYSIESGQLTWQGTSYSPMPTVSDPTASRDATPPQSGGEPCTTIVGHSFGSVSPMECGLAPGGQIATCTWVVTFEANGSYRWRHSDVAESGTYYCQAGVLYAVPETLPQVAIAYDATTHRMTWQGADYVMQP